jgi:hypothetical protein
MTIKETSISYSNFRKHKTKRKSQKKSEEKIPYRSISIEE